MSFFDEDDETVRRPRPRRPAARSGGGGRGPSSDQQTLMVRRGVALGGGIVLFLLLALVVNSCRGSARENALKDYNREVASIARASETQVGQPFFGLLSGSGADAGSPTDLQTSVSSLRVEAEKQLDQAEALDVPDQMAAAQRSLLIALEFRRDGLDFIGQRIRAALGDEGDAAEEASTQIAGQMQSFLASDVIYRARVQPLIKSALDKEEIGGQDIAGSKFVDSIEWLSPQTVATRLGGGGGGGSGDDDKRGEPAPGLHGTGLTSVAVGDLTLTPDGANRIPSSGPPTFNVEFANQGENDEENVRVDVSVKGETGRAITGSDTVETIARGASATATVRLRSAPPAGAAVTITVKVRAVPGEEKTDNNEQEYQALFTG